MKNNKLLLGSALIAGSFLSFAHFYLKNTTQYTVSANNETTINESEEAAGAASWLFNIQKNPLTGTIDPLDVLKAREEAYERFTSRSSSSALGLDWTELGPDNVGGRTRAILIDKNTPNKMFAGSIGGGIWVSTNNGGTWSNVTGFDQQPMLIISCITQAANGDIYAGTGEDLYNGFGTGATSGVGPGGMLGGGIYKSTDDGNTFNLLPSTIPSTSNSITNNATNKFLGVNNLAADPSNPNRIYAATRYGLQMTNDGGATWLHPIRLGGGTPNITRTTDVDVAPDGTVLACVSNKVYRSPNGDSATFVAVSNTGLPTSTGRIEIAVSPTDPNYMYALIANTSESLQGVYQSVDKGLNWLNIGNGGSSQFTPISQGSYALSIAVFGGDKTKIIIGGLDTWVWKQTNPNTAGIGQWSQTSAWGASGFPNSIYVHADIHTIKFSTVDPSLFYIGCDGGIFRGYDAGTNIYFQPVNKGYNVTQFYSVAFEGDDPAKRAFNGGAQDNGTNYVSGHGNTVQSAEEIGGGDGAESEISFLSPNVSFSTVYYGSLQRHSLKGGGGSSFYPDKFASLFPNLGNAGFASFVTPIALYETKTATNSPDFYKFINQPVSQTIGMGDGVNKKFSGTLTLPYPSATIVPDSISINSGLQIVTDNGAGALVGDVDGTHTNSINYITGTFEFYFNTAPANGAIVNLSFDVIYASGSMISITRSDYAYPLVYTAATQIEPGDTVMIYDPFQAKLAVGFTGANGVWMTKNALNFSTTPVWVKLGTISGDAEELAWSPDGDILYVGTSSGALYRFSNLAGITDSVNGDMASPSTLVVKTQIAGFSGNVITGLSVDPVNANKIAISVGGYGTGTPTHVYYSTTAATCASSLTTANFAGKQGTGTNKLPAMPVYSVMIEQNDPKRLIVGTEFGIYSTPDITVSNPVWSSENGVSGKFPNVPVFKIRQQRRAGDEVRNPFVIYAASHGRGVWKSESFIGPVGINETNGGITKANINNSISIFPNPMNDHGTIAFNLGAAADVSISIYNLEGRLVKTIKPGKLNSGDQKIQFSTEEFAKGTYFVSIDGNAIHATSKFVVVK